ncbi:hypothetical protein OIU76_019321, partial [Salix suchowensis]
MVRDRSALRKDSNGIKDLDSQVMTSSSRLKQVDFCEDRLSKSRFHTRIAALFLSFPSCLCWCCHSFLFASNSLTLIFYYYSGIKMDFIYLFILVSGLQLSVSVRRFLFDCF